MNSYINSVGCVMFVVLTRPGNTVVAWPKGEPMVMASRVEEVARRFLGLADLRMELIGYWVGGGKGEAARVGRPGGGADVQGSRDAGAKGDG